MSQELLLRNRQRVRRINLRLLRQITETVMSDLLGVESYELGIHIVPATEMARINKQFLQHEGSTDVIAFDYSDCPTTSPSPIGWERAGVRVLSGEIFICIDDAVAQARQFRTTWQSEIVRYIVHGILHLLGCDDSQPATRRKMKRQENHLMRTLAKRFSFHQLSAPAQQIVNRKS